MLAQTWANWGRRELNQSKRPPTVEGRPRVHGRGVSAPKEWVQPMWEKESGGQDDQLDPELKRRLLKAGARVGDVTLRSVRGIKDWACGF